MLKIGIIGFPNVGKSTLFKALTRQSVDISNYPFCTIEPNIGIVKVPDSRLESLAKVFAREKVIPAAIEFVDIAGLVKGASRGEGLGNKFLSHIRETDAILEVVRFFDKEDIAHIANRISPKEDIEIINSELILADLETINKRLEKLGKEVKMRDKEVLKESEQTEAIKECLEQGRMAGDCGTEMKELFLLTSKPILYLYNHSDGEPDLDSDLENRRHIFLDIKMEEEMSEMSESELKEIGAESNLRELIRKSYDILDLISFFTLNEKEIRAWEVERGSTAPEAGGKIHSDFEEKFIRAEVIKYDKLIELGSWRKAREKGELKTVGRDYLVEDGEVIYFLI